MRKQTVSQPAACPECGATWTEGQSCTEMFYQLLGWEFEHRLLDVHHLLVLCYHLQHPSRYSPAGLEAAKQLLVDFLEKGVSPQAMAHEMRGVVDSGRRSFKLRGTPTAHGSYARPVVWTMTVADVVQGGVEGYYANVQAWAESVLATLGASSNLA